MLTTMGGASAVRRGQKVPKTFCCVGAPPLLALPPCFRRTAPLLGRVGRLPWRPPVAGNPGTGHPPRRFFGVLRRAIRKSGHILKARRRRAPGCQWAVRRGNSAVVIVRPRRARCELAPSACCREAAPVLAPPGAPLLHRRRRRTETRATSGMERHGRESATSRQVRGAARCSYSGAPGTAACTRTAAGCPGSAARAAILAPAQVEEAALAHAAVKADEIMSRSVMSDGAVRDEAVALHLAEAQAAVARSALGRLPRSCARARACARVHFVHDRA